MSKYSEFLKSQAKKDLEFFLEQEPQRKSNKYITFNHVLSEDQIIIATDNVKFYEDKHGEYKILLIVGKNKAIYVNVWQIRTGSAKIEEGHYPDTYFVKLNRKYFKTYTFTSDFENMCFEHDETFDDLKAVALSQNDTQYHVASSASSIRRMEENLN